MSKFKNTNKVDTITPPEEPKPQFTHEQLKEALFWCWDAFERAGILFFPVHDTAKQVMKNRELSGDKVEIGVRKNEWISGGKRILDVYIADELVKEDDLDAEYRYHGVPVIIHIYEDSPCITACDRVVYEYEMFSIPNPYSKFEEIYG